MCNNHSSSTSKEGITLKRICSPGKEGKHILSLPPMRSLCEIVWHSSRIVPEKVYQNSSGTTPDLYYSILRTFLQCKIRQMSVATVLEKLLYNPRLVRKQFKNSSTTLNETSVWNNSSKTALVQPQIGTTAF